MATIGKYRNNFFFTFYVFFFFHYKMTFSTAKDTELLQRNIKRHERLPTTHWSTPTWSTLPLFGTPILKKKYFSLKKCSGQTARWTTSSFDYRSSTTEIVNLGWRTLEQRRADARLCLFYKIVAVPLPDYI